MGFDTSFLRHGSDGTLEVLEDCKPSVIDYVGSNPTWATFCDMMENPYIISMNIDYKDVFQMLPTNFGIFSPKEGFEVLDGNELFFTTTGTKPEDIIGKPLFVAFPPNEYSEQSSIDIYNSINRAISTRKCDKLPIIRYDVPVKETGGFTTKYWCLEHCPYFGNNGEVLYIIQGAMDITQLAAILQK